MGEPMITIKSRDGGALRQAGIILHQFGQPEISDVGFALSVEQDIGGLQIAMENAALVGVMHRTGDRCNQPGGLLFPVAADVRRL